MKEEKIRGKSGIRSLLSQENFFDEAQKIIHLPSREKDEEGDHLTALFNESRKNCSTHRQPTLVTVKKRREICIKKWLEILEIQLEINCLGEARLMKIYQSADRRHRSTKGGNVKVQVFGTTEKGGSETYQMAPPNL